MAERIFDVAVVGGGLVGAAAALALARAGRQVALVSAQRPQAVAERLGFDLRCVAVAPQGYDLLGSPETASPILAMRVWEEGGTAAITFKASSAGAPALAWVVESSAVNATLWDACAAHPNVELAIGVVGSLLQRAAFLSLILDPAAARQAGRDSAAEAPPTQLAARLVVAADGAKSKLRALAGANSLHRGDGDGAIATVAQVERAHGNRALQRFTAAGPLALLPLRHPHRVAVVWSAEQRAAEQLRTMPDAPFIAALQAASHDALGRIEAVDRRLLAPLAQRVADRCNPWQRLLIIGDAARTVHPLAGQGMNLGLEDVARIARAARSGEQDLGRANLWRGMAWRRRARSEATIAAMTALRAGYGYRGPVGRWLRNAGVRWVNQAETLKRALMLEAMGARGCAKRL